MPGAQATDRTRARKVRHAEPQPPSPFVRWVLRVGGFIALACGAFLSAVTLYRLALSNGWPSWAAWAFPASVDTLAATAAAVAMGVEKGQTGSRTAHLSAAGSQAMTTGFNVLYHALLPGAWTLGRCFLVATGAAPAVVVELIIVMQMALGDGANLVASTSHTDPAATGRATPPVSRTEPVATDGATPPRVATDSTPRPVATPPRRREKASVPTAAEDASGQLVPRAERKQIVRQYLASHDEDKLPMQEIADRWRVHRSNAYRNVPKIVAEIKAEDGGKPEPKPAEDGESEHDREAM